LYHHAANGLVPAIVSFFQPGGATNSTDGCPVAATGDGKDQGGPSSKVQPEMATLTSIPRATKSVVKDLHFLNPKEKGPVNKEDELAKNVAAAAQQGFATAPRSTKTRQQPQKLHFLHPGKELFEEDQRQRQHADNEGNFFSPSATSGGTTMQQPWPQQRRHDGNGQEEEKEETAAPVVQSPPGALSGVHGQELQRAEKISFRLVGVPTAQSSSATSDPTANPVSSVEESHLVGAPGVSNLAVARSLSGEEEEDLPQAAEVDPTMKEQKARLMM